jgi:hypothetical protein
VDIADLKACPFCRRAWFHVGDERSTKVAQIKRRRKIRRQILGPDAQLAASHFAMVDELRHDGFRHLAWHRKADPYIAASRAEDSGVNADQFSVETNKGTTRIAGIDGRVGLDKVFVAFDAEATSSKRADDARRHGLSETEWVSDGHHEVAYLQRIGLSEVDRGQIVRLDLQQRDVGFFVATDKPRRKLPSVFECDRNFRSAVDDVMVCENVSSGCVDDHPRASTQAGLRLLGQIKVRPEIGIAIERVVLSRGAGDNRDVDDRRSDALEHWGQCR